jgi:hypothetical protein
MNTYRVYQRVHIEVIPVASQSARLVTRLSGMTTSKIGNGRWFNTFQEAQQFAIKNAMKEVKRSNRILEKLIAMEPL